MPPSRIPETVHTTLRAYRQSLEQAFGDRLVSVRLFGSRARGDVDPESDVDVAVVVRGLSDDERARAIDLAFEAWRRARPAAFAARLERGGRGRAGAEGTPDRARDRVRGRADLTKSNRRDNARGEAALGDDALRAAEALPQLGLWNDAVSRVYYAAYHHARALLFTEGLEPKTHRGALQLLSERFEKALGPSAVADLARLQTFRGVADYGARGGITAERATAEVEAARSFVASVRGLLKAGGWTE